MLDDLESQLRRFTHGPCPSHVRHLIEAANQARIGFGDLEDLRLYIALYPSLSFLLIGTSINAFRREPFESKQVPQS